MCLTTCEVVGHITSSALAISHTHTPNKGHFRIVDKSVLYQSVRYIEVPLYSTYYMSIRIIVIIVTKLNVNGVVAWGDSLSLSLSLSHTHTHTHTHNKG